MLEEILASLADVNLRVINLGERPGLTEGRWTVQLCSSAFGDPNAQVYWATAPTATAAVIAALKAAGVNIEQ